MVLGVRPARTGRGRQPRPRSGGRTATRSRILTASAVLMALGGLQLAGSGPAWAAGARFVAAASSTAWDGAVASVTFQEVGVAAGQTTVSADATGTVSMVCEQGGIVLATLRSSGAATGRSDFVAGSDETITGTISVPLVVTAPDILGLRCRWTQTRTITMTLHDRGTGAALTLTAPGTSTAAVTPAPASAAGVDPVDTASAVTTGTDLKFIGGDASAAIVCGNVAVADDLARQRHIVLQRSRCTAKAVGGSVVLENVDIYVSSASLALNRDNVVLAALGITAVPGVAADNCDGHRPTPAPGTQLNKCWVLSHGGRLTLDNVTAVNQRSDGVVTRQVVTTKQVAAVQPAANGVAANSSGGADALCRNVATDPVNQQDDCLGTGTGAMWSMKKVDVVVHNADGSTTTRRGINVEVRGGNADAYVYCFNVTDGAGNVIQVNVCSASADGGDATLRNVTIHTSS